jgi:hypothetical protein
MKILKKITNKILRDRVRSEDIRKTCQEDNINERVRERKKRMDQQYRKNDRQQSGKNRKRRRRRATGRPRKRWCDDH